MKKIVLAQNNIRSNEDGSVEIGNVVDYLKISSRGNVSASGEATWFDDIRVEPTVRGTGAKVPAYTQWTPSGGSASGLYCYLFNNAIVAQEKEVNFKLQLPHGKKTQQCNTSSCSLDANLNRKRRGQGEMGT